MFPLLPNGDGVVISEIEVLCACHGSEKLNRTLLSKFLARLLFPADQRPISVISYLFSCGNSAVKETFVTPLSSTNPFDVIGTRAISKSSLVFAASVDGDGAGSFASSGTAPQPIAMCVA